MSKSSTVLDQTLCLLQTYIMRQEMDLRELRGPHVFVGCVLKWKYVTTYWVSMKDIKDSQPVELDEYETSADIKHDPSFAWWVSYMIKEQDRILGKVKSNYWLITHKCVLRVTKYIVEVKQIDEENINTLFINSIQIYMTVIMVKLN